MYQTMKNYLTFIQNFISKENHSFAFHPKFNYLTSSINELSGFHIRIHCHLRHTSHQIVLENHLKRFSDQLDYSLHRFQPSTLIITNRPILGLDDGEKLDQTLRSVFIVLNENDTQLISSSPN